MDKVELMTPASKFGAQEARRRFGELAARPDEEIDLAGAALLIAAEEQATRRVDVERYLTLLDEMGTSARHRLTTDQRLPVEVFNEYIFGELGFTGNESNYHDARNSFLNHVLDQRTGIPITLSCVYIEIGRRAGLHVEGIGLPGHFVVRVSAEGEQAKSQLVDPFFGKMIDEDDCQERLDVIFGGQVVLTESHLQPATTRDILVRMLANLKGIYGSMNLHRQTLAAIERILLLVPQAFNERRDRGMTLNHLDRLSEAVADLQTYLSFAPDAPDADSVREQLNKISVRLGMQN